MTFDDGMLVIGCALIGLGVGLLIGLCLGYFSAPADSDDHDDDNRY